MCSGLNRIVPSGRIHLASFAVLSPSAPLLASHCSTNSSYGRFDEARKMWGQIVNRTRDITRSLGSVGRREGDVAERLKATVC